MTSYYLRGSELNKAKRGSFEHISELLADVLSEQLDKTASVFATFPKYAYATDGSTVYRVEYKSSKDGIEVSGVFESDDVSIIGPDDMERAIGEEISSIVSEVLSEGVDMDGLRNRLHELSRLVTPDGVYQYSVAEGRITDATTDGPWIDAYRENREAVRKAVWGSIGDLESSVPKSRYAKLGAERLEDFRGELFASLDRIAAICAGLAEEVGGLVSEQEVDEIHSLRTEASQLADLVPRAVKLARSLEPLAALHDRLSERVRDMVIFGEYLARSAPNQTTE